MQKVLLILSLLVVAGFASYSGSIFEEWSLLWETWKSQYGKSYSLTEEPERFAVFVKNYNKIIKFNEENDTPKLALNKFSDLTGEEFKNQQSRCAFAETNQEFIQANTLEPTYQALPDTIDWRNKGAVTPVKDQAQCGSCWAFSTTGVLEGFNFIKKGKLLSFSEQQIVDCDTKTDQGCNGGWPYLAVEYAVANGLELESDYPYTAKDGNCVYNETKANFICDNYKFVVTQSVAQLKNALVDQPVSVLIEADQDVFQHYSKGVIKSGCGASLDHAVLAVGYTKIGVLEAWIVKNSWGADWGESGYVNIWTEAQVNQGHGVCGILSQPMIPI